MTNTDVVKKLIGDVQPYGAEHMDNRRLENLKAMCFLAYDLLVEIHNASKYQDTKERSMKEIGVYAATFLKEVKQSF
jgi:hypothetical protein